ncbi:MAG: diguanylate cyclase [Thauera sp.]|jgi:diguanylate cyclase (GGDEF)-like protein
MNAATCLRAALLGLLCLCWSLVAQAGVLSIDAAATATLGREAGLLVEQDAALSADEALAAQRAGRFSPGTASVPKFGIGAPPVWLHLALDNPGGDVLRRHLVVGVPWTDRLDVYLLREGRVVEHIAAGDGERGLRVPAGSVGHVIEHDFAPGLTELLVRAESPDPLLVPLRLLEPAQAQQMLRAHDYGYGLLYGYLFALVAYNLMLFLGLRDRSQLDYVLYVGSFMLLSLAYSGHGQIWLWPGQPEFQRYAILVLMVLFGFMGLRFASSFLGLASSLPAMHRLAGALAIVGALAMALCVVFDLQAAAGVVAFVFTLLFTMAMVLIGGVSVHRDRIAAPYFLAGALIAMAGTAITTLAVWQGLPYLPWTLHAAELGVALDGTVLTLALAYRMRRLRGERLRAEYHAAIDPLTGLRNRRAFAVEATAAWQAALRSGQPLSVIVLDLDHFKALNDDFGHSAGDAALVVVARILERCSREGDLVARWGGEEFVVLMPDTALPNARAIGLRLIDAIRSAEPVHEGRRLALSASVGVAERGAHEDLEALIRDADRWMYAAKRSGRGCVCCGVRPEAAQA